MDKGITTGKQITEAYNAYQQIMMALEGHTDPSFADAFVKGTANKLDNARTSQGGTDRALTEALDKIKSLERSPEEQLERMIQQYPAYEQELLRFFKRWGSVPTNFDPYGGPHSDPEDLRTYELAYAEQEIADTEQARDAAEHASASATSSQGGTDRKLTEALKQIDTLKATVAELTRERDAVRLAYLELLDRQAKRGK